MDTKKLRQSVIDYLESKPDYIAAINEPDVDILIDNLKYSEEAKEEMKKGMVVTIPNDNGIPTTKLNPALAGYHSCIKMYREAARALVL